MKSSTRTTPEQLDVVLIGAGIMSATLAAILKELQPGLKIELFEKLGALRKKARTPGTMPEPVTPRCAS